MFLHVKNAKYLREYKVEISFTNGKKGIADLANSLTGPVLQPLRDKVTFSHLKVDRDLQTITWPNGADFAPEYLYFKAFENEPSMQTTFKKWGYITAHPQANN